MFIYTRGRQTAARGPNAALEDKICGPRGTFQLKSYFLKTIVKKGFLVKTCNWDLFQVIAHY